MAEQVNKQNACQQVIYLQPSNLVM